MSIWITYVNRLEEIVVGVERSGVRGLQLHGESTPEMFSRLRKKFPELFLIKSLIVGRDPLKVLEDEVKAYAPFVNAFLTDTWEAGTGKSGATGKTHDWSHSRRLVVRGGHRENVHFAQQR